VAETLSGLANVLRDEGKVEEADLRAQEALAISQKAWPNQPEKWLGAGNEKPCYFCSQSGLERGGRRSDERGYH
jgi:hypothetical protein